MQSLIALLNNVSSAEKINEFFALQKELGEVVKPELMLRHLPTGERMKTLRLRGLGEKIGNITEAKVKLYTITNVDTERLNREIILSKERMKRSASQKCRTLSDW